MRLPLFKLERYFARYEFNVRHLLCCSDCESISIKELLSFDAGALDTFMELTLGYTESQGASSLRREICRLYETMEPHHILVHSGAEEAIFLFMQAILNPGDHIIVHWPCYQSLFQVARSIGCDVTFWKATEEQGWALDLNELKSHIRQETKAIILNTPHNPTGYLMPIDDFKEVIRMAADSGIAVFSDEVYRESEYNPRDRLPAACDLYERAVSLGVLSKTYGLPGLRIGWVATREKEFYNKIAALKDYTTICNSAPSEYLAEIALRHRHNIAQRNLSIIQSNLDILDGFFSRHQGMFTWVRPKAGPIAFPGLINENANAFCHELVTASGVLLLPGMVYEYPGNHFRIGFGRRSMPEALETLENFIAGSNGESNE